MESQGQLEIERKYDVSALAVKPDFRGTAEVAGEDDPTDAHLDAVYYDTVDLALAARHIAVRRRAGGTDEGWHIKLPGDEGRVERHWPLSDGSDSEVPAAIREATQLDAAAALVPVARVQNDRSTTFLRDADGQLLAEFCDDHVSSENLLSGLARSWREWEIELHDGAAPTREGRTALLDALEVRVTAAGAISSISSSKLARALGFDDLH
jgi:inorganic triphosphatase YgiF